MDKTKEEIRKEFKQFQQEKNALKRLYDEDITELMLAEEEIIKSETKFKTLFDTANDAIIVIDDKLFIDCNNKTFQIFGCSKSDIIGHSALDFSPEIQSDGCLSSEKAMEKISAALNGLPQFFEWTHTRLDGTPFEAEVSLNRLELSDKIYVQAIVRDVTERKNAEEEIKQKNAELQKINAEKDRFFSIIAHDLRGPFIGFLGLTQIMSKELDTFSRDDLLKMMKALEKSASNLLILLENLLQWSKLQQGLLPFVLSEVKLLTVVESSCSIFFEQAKIKGVDITVDISADILVYVDMNLLQAVIRNLVSNALKFTPKGGKVTISANTGEDNKVVLAIKDTGIGMSSKIVDNLFRLDVQTSKPETDVEPSSGLGLLICKDFVEKHGSRIVVKSEEGKGSTFSFTVQGNSQS